MIPRIPSILPEFGRHRLIAVQQGLRSSAMPRVTRAGAFRVRLTALLVALYLAFVLLVTLWPTTVDRPIDPYLMRFLAALHRQGWPAFIDYTFVEVGANVAFFVPVGFLVCIALPFRRAWWAIAIGGGLSALIETAQLLFLPGRVASLGDVAANTSGAVVGTVAAVLLRLVIQHRDRLVLTDVLEGRRPWPEHAPDRATVADIESDGSPQRAVAPPSPDASRR
jgi:glycopeptide antibiotics resistance protein